jgi:hypothetical protein
VTWDPAFFSSQTTSLVLGADTSNAGNSTSGTIQRSFTTPPFSAHAGAYSFVVGDGFAPAQGFDSSSATLFLESFTSTSDKSDTDGGSSTSQPQEQQQQQQQLIAGPVLRIASPTASGSKIWLLKIVVPIVVGVLLVAGVLGCLCYRAKRRSVRRRQEQTAAVQGGGMRRPKKGLAVRKSRIRKLRDEEQFPALSGLEMGEPPFAKLAEGLRGDAGNVFRQELRRQEPGR